MQEWLKELLGEAYTPQLEESLTAALAQRFVNREELDARQARWKTELETARAQAADWKQQAEQARKSAEEQVAAARFDAALNTAIGKAGGRSEKAIRALLDLDGLRTSADPEGAIAAALDPMPPAEDVSNLDTSSDSPEVEDADIVSNLDTARAESRETLMDHTKEELETMVRERGLTAPRAATKSLLVELLLQTPAAEGED